MEERELHSHLAFATLTAKAAAAVYEESSPKMKRLNLWIYLQGRMWHTRGPVTVWGGAWENLGSHSMWPE